MLAVPFRVFGSAARAGGVTTTNTSSSGIGYSSRVPHRCRYRPHGLGDPTLPLAVSSAVWSSRHRLRRPLFSDQTSPLFEFRLPLESCPAHPSQPAAARRLLSWAFAPYST
jgi:hypothetical protein